MRIKTDDFYKIFDNFLKSPNNDTLCEFLLGHHGEQPPYDFKVEWQNWEKMSKHIFGFSNILGGGAIIIGIEQNKNDNTFIIKGLDKLKDKAEIDQNLKKYIPDKLKYKVLDFTYPENYKYKKLDKKKFQVIIIEYLPTEIPFSSKIHGKDINQGTVYMRRIGSVEGVTFDELQEMINHRCTETSSAKRLRHISDYGKYNPTQKVIIEKDKYSLLEKFSATILSFENHVVTVELCIPDYFREKIIFGTGYYIFVGIEGTYVINVQDISEKKVELLMGSYVNASTNLKDVNDEIKYRGMEDSYNSLRDRII